MSILGDGIPMPGDVEKYLEARFEFEEIRKAIDLVADDVLTIGNALKREPARFSFSNTNIDLPKESYAGQTFPATEWYSASTIQEMLKTFHDARIVLRQTWAAIPAKLKSGLQPPPQGVLPPQQFERKDE